MNRNRSPKWGPDPRSAGGEVRYVDVADFPGYLVGNDGSLWSCWQYNGRNPRIMGRRWRKVSPSLGKFGHMSAKLFRDGRSEPVQIHRLVLESFVGPCPEGLEGCHNNGNAMDCRLVNLRWDTHESNMRDRLKHGTDCRGEKSSSAKLSLQDVQEIRRRLSSGTMVKEIAMEFSVAPSTISAIKRGANWGWSRKEAR